MTLRSWCVLLLLLAAGLGLRLGLMLLHSNELVTDPDGYLAHSEPLLRGAGFQGPHTGQPTAFRPPAYPVAIAMLRAAGFRTSAAVAILSLIAGTVTIVAVWIVARTSGLSERTTWLAVGGVCFDPLLLRYSILPMTEIPCAALLIAAFGFLQRSLQTRLIKFALISGLLFGVGILTRPTVLVSLTFLLLGFSLRHFRLCCVVCMAALLITAPWIVRNALHFHHFIPATTHGGYTLALGNNSAFYRDVIRGTDEFPWDGDALDRWQKGMIAALSEAGADPGDEVTADAFYYRTAMDAIRSDPASFGKSVCLRLRRFWAFSSADPSEGALLNLLTSIWYITVWIGVGMSVCLIGSPETLKNRRADPLAAESRTSGSSEVSAAINSDVQRATKWSADRRAYVLTADAQVMVSAAWITILSFMLVHMVYWTDARMRAPVMPLMLLLSAVGWNSIYIRVCRRAP